MRSGLHHLIYLSCCLSCDCCSRLCSFVIPSGCCVAELRGLPGVWAAVKYVCHMKQAERDLSLISSHAR